MADMHADASQPYGTAATFRPEPRGVLLRPLKPSDAPGVLDAFASSADMARQGDVTDTAGAEAYVGSMTDGASGRRAWAVVGDDDVAIGMVGLVVDSANRNGWFFYWMHAAHRGRGITARAARTVADWALDPEGLDLERLELGHRVNNPASGGVARAAGFVAEGLERAKFLVDGERIDVATYGRLRSDPEPVARRIPLVAH